MFSVIRQQIILHIKLFGGFGSTVCLQGIAICFCYPYIPPDAYAVRLCSGLAAELIRFNSSQCELQLTAAELLSSLSGSSADTQGFYFCQMKEHNAAIQHRADRVGQEVRHKYNIKISG